MEKSNNRRNEFIRASNHLVIDQQNLLDELKDVSYGALVLPNTAKLYRDKVLDIDDLLKDNDLDYYSNPLIGGMISAKLMEYYLQSTIVLYEMIENLNNPITKLSLKFGSGKLYKALNDNLLIEYDNLAHKIGDFNINEDLYKILIDTLVGCYGGSQSPGWFEKHGNDSIVIAKKIGAKETDEYNEKILSKIILTKEYESVLNFKIQNEGYSLEELEDYIIDKERK